MVFYDEKIINFFLYTLPSFGTHYEDCNTVEYVKLWTCIKCASFALLEQCFLSYSSIITILTCSYHGHVCVCLFVCLFVCLTDTW